MFFLRNSRNVYDRLNAAKLGISTKPLTKTGKVNFWTKKGDKLNYNYFTLDDILPSIIKACNNNRIFTQFNIDTNTCIASLSVLSCIDTKQAIVFTTPFPKRTIDSEATSLDALKEKAGLETYVRRRLFCTAFDIAEPDSMEDKIAENENNKQQKETKKQQDIESISWNDVQAPNIGKAIPIKDIEKALEDNPSYHGHDADYIYNWCANRDWFSKKENKPITLDMIEKGLKKGWL